MAYAIVQAERNLDLAYAPVLRDQLVRLVHGGVRGIVVDLSGTRFIDSAGLGVLVGLMKQLRPDGMVTVVCASPRMREIFDLTGLDHILNVESTRQGAVATTALRMADEYTPA